MAKIRCVLCAVETDNLPKSKSDHINVHLVSEHGFSIPDIDVVSDLVLGIYSRLYEKCFPQTQPAAASARTSPAVIKKPKLENESGDEWRATEQMYSEHSGAQINRMVDPSTSHVKEEPPETSANQVGPERRIPERQISSPTERPGSPPDIWSSLEKSNDTIPMRAESNESENLNDTEPAQTPSQESTPQSKQSFYCTACEKQYSGGLTMAKRHVALKHLRKNSVYCSECDYGNPWLRELVEQHINKIHDGIGKVIDKREEIMGEVKEMEHSLIRKGSTRGTAGRPNSKTPKTAQKASFYCSECDSNFSGGNSRGHVATKHLKKNNIRCSECDFGHRWTPDFVKSHIRKEHNGSGEVIDKREQIMEQVKGLVKRLITHEWRRVEKSSPHQKARISKTPQKQSFYCTECEKEYSGLNTRGHVATQHLKKNSIHCSKCDFGNPWMRDPVEKHIQKEHNRHARIIDNRAEMLEEVKQLVQQLIRREAPETSTRTVQGGMNLRKRKYSSAASRSPES